MGITKFVTTIIECDECGRESDYGGGSISLMEVESITDDTYRVRGERILCEDCHREIEAETEIETSARGEEKPGEIRSYNIHDDCDAADEAARSADKKTPYHYHDEDCEELFRELSMRRRCGDRPQERSVPILFLEPVLLEPPMLCPPEPVLNIESPYWQEMAKRKQYKSWWR